MKLTVIRQFFLRFCVVTLMLLSACSQSAPPKPDFTPTPSPSPSTVAWQDYASKFTSDTGSMIEYQIRFPKDWYFYPGTTISEPGMEGQPTIQNYIRFGNPDLPVQINGTVRLLIYALPCAGTEEGCDTSTYPLLSPGLPGLQKTVYHDQWTTWTVYLYTKIYRFSLDAYMPGTPEQNAELIKTLDGILSTLVIH